MVTFEAPEVMREGGRQGGVVLTVVHCISAHTCLIVPIWVLAALPLSELLRALLSWTHAISRKFMHVPIRINDTCSLF